MFSESFKFLLYILCFNIMVIIMTKRVYNFYAGPATLPLSALKKAQEELLDFQGTGMSLMEISHRSKEYAKMHADASGLVKELIDLPDDYKIMWLQGGASSQFYMVPLNLQEKEKSMEYVNTGVWSKKAIKEGRFYGDVQVVANISYGKIQIGIEIVQLIRRCAPGVGINAHVQVA